MAVAEPFQVRITDLRQRFRPQREWAEGRGMLLILAHFFTGTGAGAWLLALSVLAGAPGSAHAQGLIRVSPGAGRVGGGPLCLGTLDVCRRRLYTPY